MPPMTVFSRLSAISLICIGIVSSLSGLSLIGIAAAQTVYPINRGDTVQVTVFDEPDLSGAFTVDTNGAITLALIGKLRIATLTPDQAEQKIRAAYRDGYLRQPDITVDVIEYRPFFILGEVNQPDSYDFAPGMNVMNAIALGGGLTYRGDEDDIEILRGHGANRVTLPATLSTLVLPGDTVRVGERFF